MSSRPPQQPADTSKCARNKHSLCFVCSRLFQHVQLAGCKAARFPFGNPGIHLATLKMQRLKARADRREEEWRRLGRISLHDVHGMRAALQQELEALGQLDPDLEFAVGFCKDLQEQRRATRACAAAPSVSASLFVSEDQLRPAPLFPVCGTVPLAVAVRFDARRCIPSSVPTPAWLALAHTPAVFWAHGAARLMPRFEL